MDSLAELENPPKNLILAVSKKDKPLYIIDLVNN